MGERVALFAEPDDEETLVDLLDRVLDIGVMVEGDVILAVAGIDLVHVELKLFIASAGTRHAALSAPGHAA